jgi:hypothetical protein
MLAVAAVGQAKVLAVQVVLGAVEQVVLVLEALLAMA